MSNDTKGEYDAKVDVAALFAVGRDIEPETLQRSVPRRNDEAHDRGLATGRAEGAASLRRLYDDAHAHGLAAGRAEGAAKGEAGAAVMARAHTEILALRRELAEKIRDIGQWSYEHGQRVSERDRLT